MRVNFDGFVLLRNNSQFVPPKNKKSFPFLRSFSLCGLEFPGEKSGLIYDENHRSVLVEI
jgi:hypothetical protein